MKKFSGVCLDTNIFIKIENNFEEIKNILDLNQKNYFPLICKAELFTGFEKENKFEREKIFTKVSEIFSLKILIIDEESINFYIKIFWFLKEKGIKITQNDLLILTLCFQKKLMLITYDNKLKKCWKLISDQFLINI